MRKRTLIAMLAMALMLILCACGGSSDNSAAPTQIPAQSTPAPTPEATPAADPFTVAQEYVDRDVSELIAVIGEPMDSSYASSCVGPGEDGELYYEGFTVYTYREGDSETVQVILE